MSRYPRILFLVVAPFLLLGGAAGALDAAVPLTKVQLVESLTPAAIDKLAAVLFNPLPAPRGQLTVDSWLLTFSSVYPDGAPATITAQLFVPRFKDSAIRPLYVFATGSTGITAACRASREHLAGIHWGLYRTHVLTFASQGVIGVLPDYMGFADKGRLQPFYSAVAEGRMMLDTIRAVRTFLDTHATKGVDGFKAFVAGFSQGGHAAFAAADLRSTYAPDVSLSGVIGYGPVASLFTLFSEFPVDAPMAIYTYSKMYGTSQFDPGKILLPKWAGTLENDVTRQCIGGMQAYYPWKPRDMFRKEFADALLGGTLKKSYPSIYRILNENSTGMTHHRVPALILEGTDDIVISVKTQTAFADSLRAAGSAVQLSIYKGARHDTRQAGFSEALHWMQSLTKGGTPPSGTSNRP